MRELRIWWNYRQLYAKMVEQRGWFNQWYDNGLNFDYDLCRWIGRRKKTQEA